MHSIGSLFNIRRGLSSLTHADFPVEYAFYTKEDFISDLAKPYQTSTYNKKSKADKYLLKAGDIVIHNASQAACVVSRSNENKVLSVNFTALTPKNKQTCTYLDAYYFCFLFNEHPLIQKQKLIQSQGLASQVLSAQGLSDISLPLIPLAKQALMGEIYASNCYLTALYQKRAALLSQAHLNYLKNIPLIERTTK